MGGAGFGCDDGHWVVKMDITGIDIAAVATLVGSIGTAATAVVKAVQAVRKAEAADT